MTTEAVAKPAKGPLIWLDMDQAELDAAYDQSAYAPNREQIQGRNAANSEGVRARLGAPRRYAYGPTSVEGLDVYVTGRAGAPINVFIHGGAWRAGLAKNYATPAELFVHAGAHYVVPDFAAVQDVGGSLMPMAEQVRRAVAWVYRHAHTFGGIRAACTSPASPRALTSPASSSPRTGCGTSTCPPTSSRAGSAAAGCSISSRCASRRGAATSRSPTRWSTR